MRKIGLLVFLLSALICSAQLTIQSGATFFIQTGATVVVQGDVTSNADIQGPGTLLMKGTSLQNLNMNGFVIPNLQIDNTNNVLLGGAASLSNSMTFTNGKIQLSTYNLTLSSTATITGNDNTKFFITDNTGRLMRLALGASPFTFPVGNNASSYTPITLTQNGTVDDIGVKCLQHVFSNGGSGSPFVKEVVDVGWDISEGTPGGSNINMTTTWSTGQELPGFNRTRAGVSFYDGTGWDMTNSMTGAASGTNPYSFSRNSVSSLGIFAVGTRPVLTTLLVSPKIYLQGAYVNTGTPGLMRDDLRAAGVIPLTEPYTGYVTGTFTHSGSGGGETIPSTILTSTGTGADIVDWVFAELRDGVSGSVITTRAVLVQRDGNLVDVDGTNSKTSYINFAGQATGNYYVSIRHRNHIGIRSPGNLSLSRTTTTSYDFTTSASQAFNSIQADLGSGRFGMYGGNVNGNNNVKYIGPANDENEFLNVVLSANKLLIISSAYNRGDVNMNGNVKYIGPNNDENFLLNIALSANKLLIITQPF